MPTSVSSQRQKFRNLSLVTFVLFASGCFSFKVAAQTSTAPTTIDIAATAKLTNAKRMGLNLGAQDFYDAGIFMRNLTFNNPGFEAGYWQSILHCKYVTATSCTDDDQYAFWPSNFFKGAAAEFLVGSAAGTKATVASSAAANSGAGKGVTVSFASLPTAPSVGDYVVVRMQMPGGADQGWWTQSSNTNAFTTELSDLSANTIGKQALRITTGATQYATVSSYMDSTPGKSFLQLNGLYTLTFRAKGTGGANQVEVSLARPSKTFLDQTITLTNSWQDYTIPIQATDTNQVGTLALTFKLYQSSMLLDDVALTAAADADNPTAYRNEVVKTLKNLHPGILRYMDSGTNWGSSIDNMIAPDFARMRTGYNDYQTTAGQIPMGLQEYLVLCQTIGAEPWYTMQTGMSTQEMSNLMDYLGGSESTVYGAKRAAMGQAEPWTSVFTKIHLEFGNEVWNTSNPGASMTDPASYGKRAKQIFATARASASYSSKFDLILGGWQAIPYWNQIAMAASGNYDTLDVAAYVFGQLNDASSNEAIYGPMFAEPEAITTLSNGLMVQEAATAAAAAHPARLSVYEENMGTVSGAASQAQVNKAIASVGAGINTANNMLMMLREQGVTDQNMFALPGFFAPYTGLKGSTATTAPIWGIVIDMGGPTNLVRPAYLGEQLLNSAILPTLLNTAQLGSNPTWNQKLTANNIANPAAHYIQSYAFTDGNKLNVIVFNLSRTTALPINFSGANSPLGAATISTLTAADINANNETQENVAIAQSSMTLNAGTNVTLPPFSMTIISTDAPTAVTAVTGVSATCAQASISPGDTDACSATVTGTGDYTSNVKWSATVGSVSSKGVYTAPATAPSNGQAVITATSTSDPTKKASFTVAVVPDAIASVALTCPVTKLGQGAKTTCTVKVIGTGDFSRSVKWTASAGTIDASGDLTAPTTGTSVTVTATSTQDATKSDSVTITLVAPLTIGTPSYTATATTATITWQTNVAAHSGLSYGTTTGYGSGTTPWMSTASTTAVFTLTGLKPSTKYYALLYSIDSAQTVTKAFTFMTGETQSVTGVTVSCPSSSLAGGTKMTCTSQVTGTGTFSKDVVWSASAGSITASGVFTAPTNAASAVIKATSADDSSKHATFTVTVSNPAGTAPKTIGIYGVTATDTTTTATISWSTGVPTHSGISYGTSMHYGSGTTPYNPIATATPSITLTKLKPNTTYYLFLFSSNASKVVTKTYTIKTAAK